MRDTLECPLCHKEIAYLHTGVAPSLTCVRCDNCKLELYIDWYGDETHAALEERWKKIGQEKQERETMSDVDLRDNFTVFCECGAAETQESKDDSDWLKFQCGAEFEPDGSGGEWKQVESCGLRGKEMTR